MNEPCGLKTSGQTRIRSWASTSVEWDLPKTTKIGGADGNDDPPDHFSHFVFLATVPFAGPTNTDGKSNGARYPKTRSIRADPSKEQMNAMNAEWLQMPSLTEPACSDFRPLDTNVTVSHDGSL
jgi:hypothetical protein